VALDRALLGGPSTSPLERVKPLAALPVLTLLAVGAPEAADVSPLLPSDREILQIVLEDFARSPDSVQYNRESPHTYVAVDPLTNVLNDPSYVAWHTELANSLTPRPPESAVKDFLQRNRRAYSTTELKLSSALRIQTSKDAHEDSWFDKPDVRTFVRLEAPGYSSDGQLALVWFNFRWSIHDARGLFILRRSGSSWVIVAHRVDYYV